MATVTRLVTFVDIDGDATSTTQLGISARHEAELTDGRRIVLLDDRGWGESISPNPTIPDIWTHQTLEEIGGTARVVVGPDEPPDGLSHEDMAEAHWAQLEAILHRSDVTTGAAELRRLPHEVVPSARLLARIDHPSRSHG